MTITINPFLLGVITTLLAEFIIFVVWVVVKVRRASTKK